MEEAGLIQLPPLDVSKQRSRKNSTITEFQIDPTPITGELKVLEPIHLGIARAGIDLKRWRHFVNEYHMLGDKQVFGSRLAYFIKSRETIIGCIQFSASSWALSSLAVTEFHKRETPMGPPTAHRMGKDEVKNILVNKGFTVLDDFDLGDNFYCLVFTRDNREQSITIQP